MEQGPPKGATLVSTTPPKGATLAQSPPADPFVQAPPQGPQSPTGSVAPLVGSSASAGQATPQARIPTQAEDPAAFAFNSAALLGEDAPINTPEQVALAVNAKRLRNITAPARKQAPYVDVPQRDDMEVPSFAEQQYTPAMKAAKEEAGTWTSGDEFRFQDTGLRQQANALTKLRNDLALRVQQQGGTTPEDEAQLAAMQQQQQILDGAYRELLANPPKDGFDLVVEERQKTSDKEFKRAQALAKSGNYLHPEVIEEYAVKPGVNAANEFIVGGLIGGASRMLDFAGNIPAKLSGQEEYYSPFAEFADNINRGMEATSAYEAGETKGNLFDKDWNFNGDAALPQLIRTGVYMAGLMASGGYGGRAGLGTASFLSTEEDYYQEAIDAGLKPNEAQQFSILAAGATASLEGVNPQLYGQGTVKGQMAQRALKALKDGSTMKEAIKDGTLFVLKEVGGENVQELSQAGSDMLARYVVNQKVGENKLDPSMTPQEAVETILLTTALSGLAASAGRAADRPLRQQALEWATQNPEAMEMFINTSVAAQQREPLLQELQRRTKIERGLPEQVQGPQRWEVASAVAEKEKIKEEQAEASVDETVASIAGNKFEERIAEQDERIAKAMGVTPEDLEKKAETDRLREQYDKAKLKSEITGQPMPEGSKRPAEFKLEPSIPEVQEPIPASEQVGLGPEPVVAEGAAQVAPDAAVIQTPQQDVQEEIAQAPEGDIRPSVRPEQTQPTGILDEALREGGGVDAGQPSAEPLRVSNSGLNEDQPTVEAPSATDRTEAPGASIPDLDTPPKPPPVSKPSPENDPTKGKRETTQRMLRAHPELKDAVTEKAVYYSRIPRSISEPAARAIIEAEGIDSVAKAIMDDRPMPGAVRSMLGQMVAHDYIQNREYEKWAEFSEKWTEGITDAAQMLSALRTLSGSPEAMLFQAQRQVRKRRERQEEAVSGKTEKLSRGLRKINEETAEEVIRTRKVRQKTSDASEAHPTERTTDPPSYGAKNRVVTKKRYNDALKALRGKLMSGVPPELVEIAAFHIEAGARSFAAVAEKVTKRLGNKALPYLKEAYKRAHSLLTKEKVDVGDVSTDEEINEYISKELAPAALKDGLRALDLKIDDIIRKHWTEQEDIRRSLADKFIQDAGLNKEEAESLAKAVQSEFDKIATEKKQKLIQSIFSIPTRVTKARKVKGVEDELILLTNLGAFSDAELTKKYGDKMGFAGLTEENIAVLQGLADEVSKAKEGRPKFDAIERLVAYQANLKGISKAELIQSVWYAHMLSGYMTHLVNIFANFSQVASETGVAILQRPKDAKYLARAIMHGAYKGWLEAGASFRTGTSPIRGKVEVPAALERIQDQYPRLSNILRAHKYVRRAMVAADVMGYETAKELRAYQWAVKMARFDTTDPSMDVRQKALDYLNETDEAIAAAKEEAQMEYEADVSFQKSEHEKGAITKKEMEKNLKTAERNRKRREFELVESGRNEQVQEASGKFGARVTYNYKPEGLLGAITNGVNNVIEQVPALAYVIPFRNIIANVANEAINYTPLGFARAASARGSITGSLAPDKYKQALSPKMTPEQLQQHKLDLTVKASLGIALMTAAFFLSDPGDDDDPTIEITANGYGEWKKNMALKETGWQPYSFKIGNKWYSYQYTPLVLVFGIVGNYRDAQKYRKEKVGDTQYTQLATAMGRTLPAFLDMTFLSTVDKVLSAVSNPSGEGVMEDLVKQGERTAKTLIVPALFTQASKEVQNLTDTPQKDVRGTMMGEMLKDIPVLRDAYQDQVNALGEPIIPKTDRFISSADPDPVWSLFAEKAYAIQTPNSNALTVMDGDKERVMTPKERHDYLVLRGKYIREKIEANFSRYEKMDKEKFADKMRALSTAASKRAKKKLVLEPTDPEVMQGPWFED